ncbi:MAG: hypothetical protein R3B46_14415 [Phycisphaerales bacterium]|nr:hypothetical protein [Phycisphaerales bacterium]
MTSRTAPSRLPVRETEALLEDLARGDQSPGQIAKRHNMTVAQLTRWATSPSAAERIENARRLANERAALAVAVARVAAASALHRWALNTEHPETARRACVDLLKLDQHPPADEPAPQPEPADLSAESREAIRAALEHIESRTTPAEPSDQ